MAEEKRIAVGVTQDGTMWDGHFGMSPVYQIYDGSRQLLETRTNPHGVGQGAEKEHGNPRQILDLLHDCNVFITRLTGFYIKQVERAGVEVITTELDDPLQALDEYLASAQQS
jgi:predicted Fe-Mo cluster-binding NifX family protein